MIVFWGVLIICVVFVVCAVCFSCVRLFAVSCVVGVLFVCPCLKNVSWFMFVCLYVFVFFGWGVSFFVVLFLGACGPCCIVYVFYACRCLLFWFVVVLLCA